MQHPPLHALLEAPPSPEVRAHLERCPRCRVDLRLHRGSLAEAEIDTAPASDLDLPAPGTVIEGLEVWAWIGSGGFGDVLLVERRRTGERLALKVAREPSASLRARMQRELAVGRLVAHPNLLPTLDLLEIHGRPALLTPYVPGCSLERLMAWGPLAPAEALALLDGVLAGLGAAHAAGVVHRDLKPANVLLDPRSGALVPVLADFGLARARDPLSSPRTRSGARLGTLAYAAPEQLRDASRVDGRADLFSVGVLLYTLLCGDLPFPQRDLIARHEAIVTRAWTPAGARLPALDPALDALMSALLSPDPEHRPASAEEVRARLGAGRLPGVAGAALERTRAEARRVEGARPAARGAAAGEVEALVGREQALEALFDLIEGGARLVTLHGPGGVGKTALCRAALSSPRLSTRDWPGGAWWVAAKAAADADALARLIGAELGLQAPGQGATEALARALAGRGPTLIALDEVEGALEAARALAERALARAPELALICTSRIPLDTPGEQVFPVDPLAPEDAAALLRERARRARGRPLEDSEGPDVQSLARRLDGLPLALELAAGRLRQLTPAALLVRLERGQELLSDAGRLGRHGSLNGMLAATWSALEPAQARLAARISVFVAPFDLDAAEALLDDPGLIALDLLDGLVHRALLSLVHTPLGPRWAMLETIRAYAESRLGADRARALALHRDHVLRRADALAERVWAHTRDQDIRALGALVPELKAIHTRFEDPETVLRTAVLGVAGTFWTAGGAEFFFQGGERASSSLPESDLTRAYEADRLRLEALDPEALEARIQGWPGPLRARAILSAIFNAGRAGRQLEVIALAERARQEGIWQGAPAAELRAGLYEAVAVGYTRGQREAEPLLRALVAQADPEQQTSLRIQATLLLVDIVQLRGGDAGAQAREAVILARRAADPLHAAVADLLLGAHLCRQGLLGEGVERLRRAEDATAHAMRARHKAQLCLAEFLTGAEGEAVALRLAEDARREDQELTACLARALAGVHAALDGRPAGLDARLAEAERRAVAPLTLAWVRTARALLARSPLIAPLDEALPPGLRRALIAATLEPGSPAARARAEEAARSCEPHLAFYAGRALRLRDALEARA